MGVNPNQEQEAVFRDRLETMGVNQVRGLVSTPGHFNAAYQLMAVKWIAEKDQESERLSKVSQAEQIEIARSAKDAAWEAARAARTANKIAAAALVAAVIAITVSIISLLRSH